MTPEQGLALERAAALVDDQPRRENEARRAWQNLRQACDHHVGGTPRLSVAMRSGYPELWCGLCRSPVGSGAFVSLLEAIPDGELDAALRAFGRGAWPRGGPAALARWFARDDDVRAAVRRLSRSVEHAGLARGLEADLEGRAAVLEEFEDAPTALEDSDHGRW